MLRCLEAWHEHEQSELEEPHWRLQKQKRGCSEARKRSKSGAITFVGWFLAVLCQRSAVLLLAAVKSIKVVAARPSV